MADTRPSSLLEYLPAIYRDEPFVGQFLLAFEKLLFGRDDGFPAIGATGARDATGATGTGATGATGATGVAKAWEIARRDRSIDLTLPDAPPSLERTIAGIATYFDPDEIPGDFLPWLVSWTAFSLRADLDERQQREFIAKIIPLYRRRGTKTNLVELLKIFTIAQPTITEADDPPHFFTVTVRLVRHEPAVQLRQIGIANAIVELAKPAHTDFKLDLVFPSMQIGEHSTVGVDTLLGTTQSEGQA